MANLDNEPALLTDIGAEAEAESPSFEQDNIQQPRLTRINILLKENFRILVSGKKPKDIPRVKSAKKL